MSLMPTMHEKNEWKRFGDALYAKGLKSLANKYYEFANISIHDRMPVNQFDELQNAYRKWLCFDQYPV